MRDGATKDRGVESLLAPDPECCREDERDRRRLLSRSDCHGNICMLRGQDSTAETNVSSVFFSRVGLGKGRKFSKMRNVNTVHDLVMSQ